MIPDWAQSGAPLFIFLFFAVFLRAQTTYWLGRLAARGAVAGSRRSGPIGRIARWFSGPTPQRGAALLTRWGPIIIPLCFLTVGIQTAVNAGAGLVRMRWSAYTLAMIPGCVAWSALYGLGMLAVWTAFLTVVAGSVWGWLGLAALVILIVVIRRNRAGRARPIEVPAKVRAD